MIPEDEDWEVDYAEAQNELYAKYSKPLPQEFQESEASKSEAAADTWKPAPRVTEADRTNDFRSLHRKLDRRLILMVKAKGLFPAA